MAQNGRIVVIGNAHSLVWRAALLFAHMRTTARRWPGPTSTPRRLVRCRVPSQLWRELLPPTPASVHFSFPGPRHKAVGIDRRCHVVLANDTHTPHTSVATPATSIPPPPLPQRTTVGFGCRNICAAPTAASQGGEVDRRR